MGRARRDRAGDAVEAVIEVVEVRVGEPGLVEMQRLDGIAQALLDRIDVVAEPVIGGIGDDNQPDLAGGVLGERMARQLRRNRRFGELILRNRADDPEAVTRRQEIDGGRPRHDQGMQDRLVAVPVAENVVATPNHPVPDDLVSGRGATGNEERLVRAEDPRRVALALGDWAGVVEERPELAYRYGDVGPQRVLTEEFVEER